MNLPLQPTVAHSLPATAPSHNSSSALDDILLLLHHPFHYSLSLPGDEEIHTRWGTKAHRVCSPGSSLLPPHLCWYVVHIVRDFLALCVLRKQAVLGTLKQKEFSIRVSMHMLKVKQKLKYRGDLQN